MAGSAAEMQGHAALAAENGLTDLARAISRSTALHVAMSITPEDGGVEAMLANADRLAAWIGEPVKTQSAGGWL